MVNNADVTLTVATEQVLKEKGPSVLLAPDEFFAGLTQAMGPGRAELSLLARVCDERLLAPFSQVALSQNPTSNALQHAAGEAMEYLQANYNISTDDANMLAGQLMAGIGRYFDLVGGGAAAYADTAPTRDDYAAQGVYEQRAPEQVPEQVTEQVMPVTDSQQESSKKKIPRKRIAIIAAAAVVLIGIVAAIAVPRMFTSVRFGDYDEKKDYEEDISGLKWGTIDAPDSLREREGYEFAGWQARRGDEVIAPGEPIKVSDSSYYTAVWNPVVSFDGNGASKGKMDDVVVKYGEEYELPECAFTREGYMFKGWTTSEDSLGEVWLSGTPAGEKVEVYQPETYHALWYPDAQLVQVSIPGPGTIEGTIENWLPDSGRALLLVTNKAPGAVHVQADFTAKSESGTQVDSGSDFALCIGPGETTIMNYSISETKATQLDYKLTVEEGYSFNAPITACVTSEIESADKEEMTVKLRCSSENEANVSSIFAVGTNKEGQTVVVMEYSSLKLAKDQEAEVTFTGTSTYVNGLSIDWGAYDWTLYIDGYERLPI